MVWVLLCLMKKRKGRLALNVSQDGEDFSMPTTPLGATAWVPFSSTCTKVLWTTFDRYKLGLGEIPVRSAFVSSKISVKRPRSHHSRGWLPPRPDRIFTGMTGRSPAHLVRCRIVRSAPCRGWCPSLLTLCACSHPHDQDACLFHHPKTLPEGHTHLTAHLVMSDLFSIPIVCHF